MGYQFNGIDPNDYSGNSVSSAGDVTGDGIDDLIIGAVGANGEAGESYLISGADLVALDNATANGGIAGDGIIELADVAAIGTSYQFNGIDPDDQSGYSVSSAGDVTGDGVDDLIIGARGADPNGDTKAGETYLISGADLAHLDAMDGSTDGVIELSNVAPACFLTGTGIATAQGETCVEDLQIGDLIRTAAGDLVPVKWIGRETVLPALALPRGWNRSASPPGRLARACRIAICTSAPITA